MCDFNFFDQCFRLLIIQYPHHHLHFHPILCLLGRTLTHEYNQASTYSLSLTPLSLSLTHTQQTQNTHTHTHTHTHVETKDMKSMETLGGGRFASAAGGEPIIEAALPRTRPHGLHIPRDDNSWNRRSIQVFLLCLQFLFLMVKLIELICCVLMWE